MAKPYLRFLCEDPVPVRQKTQKWSKIINALFVISVTITSGGGLAADLVLLTLLVAIATEVVWWVDMVTGPCPGYGMTIMVAVVGHI